MPRPTWKGHITFGLVNIPVALYPGEQRNELSFNLLDSRNKARVRYERVNEVTGEQVPYDQIVKGYETDDHQYVLLGDADFRKAAVEATQAVEITDFVDRDEIPYAFFEKPYYLAPGKKGDKGYVLLRETLKRTGKAGIAKVVIRTREYLAAVIAEGNALVLELLRFQDEIRNPEELKLPEGEISEYKITEKELDMAEKLVEAMTSEWEPEKYHDEYREALMKWIEEKVRRGQVEPTPEGEVPEVEEPAQVVDMMDLLKKSLEEGKTQKKAPAKKKTAEKKRAAG